MRLFALFSAPYMKEVSKMTEASKLESMPFKERVAFLKSEIEDCEKERKKTEARILKDMEEIDNLFARLKG